MKSLISPIFAVFLVYSCSEVTTTEILSPESLDNLTEFELVEQKNIAVDSSSDWYFVIPQYFNLNNQPVVLSLDLVTNSILIYDLQAGNLKSKITYTVGGGPQEVRADLIGYQAMSDDKLLLVDHTRTLYVSDFEGTISQTYSLLPENSQYTNPIVKPSAVPFVMHEGKLQYESYPIINKNRNMKLSLSLIDSTIEVKEMIPDEHIEGFYGVGDFLYYSYVADTTNSRFIYSFPALDSLYIWNFDFQKLEKRATGSRLFKKPIEPILDLSDRPTPQELEQIPLKRPVYSRLLFHKDKRVYYRLVGLPIPQNLLDLKDPVKSLERKYVVMVLNEDFQWRGEFELPEYRYKINIDLLFIGPKGLYLQKESTNENLAEFDVWSVTEK